MPSMCFATPQPTFLVENMEGRYHFGKLGIDGSIKMALILGQVNSDWLPAVASLKAVMKLQDP